jgi:hypothetical protein
VGLAVVHIASVHTALALVVEKVFVGDYLQNKKEVKSFCVSE